MIHTNQLPDMLYGKNESPWSAILTQIQTEEDSQCCSNFDDGVEVLEDGAEEPDFNVFITMNVSID
jgi:hypothetical protein